MSWVLAMPHQLSPHSRDRPLIKYLSDRWRVAGITDSHVPATFSVNSVRIAYDIEAEISVATGA